MNEIIQMFLEKFSNVLNTQRSETIIQVSNLISPNPKKILYLVQELRSCSDTRTTDIERTP